MADPALLTAISKGAPLQHVETADKSAPQTDPRGAVLGDITKGHELKHAQTADKSAPIIESDVKVKKVDRGTFLTEVTADHSLQHVETVDKSKPAVEGASVGKSVLPSVLAEIKKQ